jgi:hypothetical protein
VSATWGAAGSTARAATHAAAAAATATPTGTAHAAARLVREAELDVQDALLSVHSLRIQLVVLKQKRSEFKQLSKTKARVMAKATQLTLTRLCIYSHYLVILVLV